MEKELIFMVMVMEGYEGGLVAIEGNSSFRRRYGNISAGYQR
ncbi:hypothetical protein SAMN05421747_101461 [Parapedobacter composti]|uniref:Uncharacterized protein n=1 Tax=Parapedobacter composti TaxID=623281 RepID=A0A1I1EBW3_9SPHI|nr:hypothetical protein SAMN05421747_101461 [Parapedobacter composti]